MADRKDSPQEGPDCAATGKIGWLSRSDAKCIRTRMKTRGDDVSGLQAYPCEMCGYFHLGSKLPFLNSRWEHRAIHKAGE